MSTTVYSQLSAANSDDASDGQIPVPEVNAPLVVDPQPEVRPNDHVPPGRIMIVDDESLNIAVAKKLLTMAGHSDFVTTTDSTLAMNMVHTCLPDVILLDINMPKVDGISILSQIRSVRNSNICRYSF